MNNKDKREVRLADVSFEETEGKMILEGYAIVFEQETLIGDTKSGFKEVIDSRALTDTLMKDVPMKYNHMDNILILARTKNGSLALSVDNVGLKVHAELIDTTTNADIYKMVRAGLLDKMSFAFVVSKQSWDRSGDVPIRRILGIERLYDVSVVDLPAYDGTSIYSRSLALVDAELKAMDLADEELKRKQQEKEAQVIRTQIHIKTII